jgi:hypothetical protein
VERGDGVHDGANFAFLPWEFEGWDGVVLAVVRGVLCVVCCACE